MGALHNLQCDVSRTGEQLNVVLPAWNFGLPTAVPDPLRDRLELSICQRGNLVSKMVYGNPAQIALHAAITAMVLLLTMSGDSTDSLGWKDAFILALIGNSIPFALSLLNAEMLRRRILRAIRL